MKIRNVVIFIAFLLITVSFIIPDYLVVSRNVTIKEEPKSDAKIIGNAKEGDSLQLLSTEQKNGYYYVKVPNTPAQGWVYRTFVRRDNIGCIYMIK